MKKIIFRFKAAFTAAKVAFLNPELMASAHFTIMAQMYENILSVQQENRNRTFQIGILLPENEMHAIATVWVGAGADSSPMKRIEQLYNENQELRGQLAGLLTPKQLAPKQ